MTAHGRLQGTLRIYDEGHGGRTVTHGWVSGLLRFDEDLTAADSLFGCRVYFLEGREELNPGEEAPVVFWTIAEFDLVERAIRPGMQFRYWSGRDIGEGVITTVDPEEL